MAMRCFGTTLAVLLAVAHGVAHKEAALRGATSGTTPKRAFVTMLVNDQNDESYVKAAAALAYSLKQKSKYPVIVAITRNISETTRCQLKATGAEVKEIEEIMDECPSPLPVCDKTKASFDRRWVSQFTKLHLWSWTDYDQLVFYDADHLITGNVDDVFDKCKEGFCTATDDSQGGFFVMRPSKDTERELLTAFEGAKKANWTFHGENMWNEQPLLVKFFMEKQGGLPMKIGYHYHGSNYKGVPAYNSMKAIHSKFWVEPLTPGRNKWYDSVKAVNKVIKEKGCTELKALDPIPRAAMAADAGMQLLSGKKLNEIHVAGFR